MVPHSRFREKSSTFLFDSRCLEHPFAIFYFESTPRNCFAISFAHFTRNFARFCPPYHLDVKFRDNHSRFVSFNALHLKPKQLTEHQLPPRTVSSRTSPPPYAEVLSASEGNYAPAQFTFHFIAGLLLAFLCNWVTCFLFVQFDFCILFLFSMFNSDGGRFFQPSQFSFVSFSPKVPIGRLRTPLF